MKRLIALLLAAMMLLCVLTACNKEDTASTTEETIDRESLANAQLERETYVVGIVLDHCGLSEDQINVMSLNTNEEAKTLDFFFLHGDIEYVYTVNYETGEIIHYTSNTP